MHDKPWQFSRESYISTINRGLVES
jgi:hypothetical protein